MCGRQVTASVAGIPGKLLAAAAAVLPSLLLLSLEPADACLDPLPRSYWVYAWYRNRPRVPPGKKEPERVNCVYEVGRQGGRRERTVLGRAAWLGEPYAGLVQGAGELCLKCLGKRGGTRFQWWQTRRLADLAGASRTMDSLPARLLAHAVCRDGAAAAAQAGAGDPGGEDTVRPSAGWADAWHMPCMPHMHVRSSSSMPTNSGGPVWSGAGEPA